MRIKCLSCSTVMDEDDLIRRGSYLCEYGCTPVHEMTLHCPVCNATEFMNAAECRVCGEWHIKASGYDDVPMHDGICEECLCKASVDECVEIAKEEGKHMVEINAFLASSFTPSEIEEILIEVLKRSPRKAVTDYVMGDPEWFTDRYKDIKKNNGEL